MSRMTAFQPKFRKQKPKRDRTFGDGRVFLADKGELREQVFERSGGQCEEIREKHVYGSAPYEDAPLSYLKRSEGRCNALITLATMELSHVRHGCHRDDSMAGTIASCKPCHRAKHSSQKIPRRPGKQMSVNNAKVYWESNSCFCDKNKREKTSFCPECMQKLNPQTAYTLENADDQKFTGKLSPKRNWKF
jgi:hypothetical protein